MSPRLLMRIVACLIVTTGCTVTTWVRARGQDRAPRQAEPSIKDEGTATDDPTARARNRMVQRHLVERGIKNKRVLDAFRTVPRHRFVPREIPARWPTTTSRSPSARARPSPRLTTSRS